MKCIHISRNENNNKMKVKFIQSINIVTLNKWPVYGKSSFMYDIHFFASISVDNQHGKNTWTKKKDKSTNL